MARVGYVDGTGRPELDDLVDRIRSGRRGDLLNLYKALLNSPPLATSWLDHIGAVRWSTDLDGALREIVIIRIGQLTETEYALRQHIPKLALAEGLSLEKCDAIATWQSSRLFTAPERAALAFAEAMTKTIKVSDAVFAPLQDHFTDRQIVELAVLIAAYNMHNRFVQALAIDLEA
jgi:alkylhydroperoxidase family enzyme